MGFVLEERVQWLDRIISYVCRVVLVVGLFKLLITLKRKPSCGLFVPSLSQKARTFPQFVGQCVILGAMSYQQARQSYEQVINSFNRGALIYPQRFARITPIIKSAISYQQASASYEQVINRLSTEL